MHNNAMVPHGFNGWFLHVLTIIKTILVNVTKLKGVFK